MNKTRNLRIKDIFNVVSGATPSSKVESFWDGDVIWVTPADMTDFGYIESGSNNITLEGYNSCGTQYVPKGSIIISSRAPIGKINIAQNKLCTNQGCKSLVLSTKEVNSKYVAYYLYNVVEEINSLGQGTTFNELPLKRLVSFNVKLPSKDEQQHIVDYLDEKLSAIDKRVENLEKQKNAYARLKKSVIHQAVTRGLNPDVSLKDSGIEWIGMIPEHWEVKRIKDLCSFVSRGSTPDYVDESDFPVMNQAVFSSGCINHEVVRYSSYMKPESKIEKGDLLIASTGGGILGKLYFFNIEDEQFYADTHVTIVRSPKKTFCVKFLYYLLSIGYNMINSCMAKGSTNQTELQRDKLIAYEIAIPSIEEQTRIIDYLDEKCTKIDAAIENISKQIDASKRLKRALINEVITGQRAV